MEPADVPSILRKVLEVTELTQGKLGKKVGVSQGTVSKWINEEHAPNKRQWDRILALAAKHPSLKSIIKEGVQQTTVAVMGYIGAGAEIDPDFEQVPPEGLEQLDLPIPVPLDIVAFRVRGASMRPAYREGDVVLVSNDQRADAKALMGQVVVVLTEDGKRYLKEIQPGQRRGTFSLYSHNADPILDVRIKWVGEIYLIIPARRLARRVRQRKIASA